MELLFYRNTYVCNLNHKAKQYSSDVTADIYTNVPSSNFPNRKKSENN